MVEESKQFFFEKKNQKTFASVGFAGLRRVVSSSRDSARKSFLLLFSEKESLAFFQGAASVQTHTRRG